MKMKEKGFTLVELLTVFAILSIILGMVVVNVNNYSSKQREKDYENLVKIIEENAKVLVNKNEDLFVGVTNNASSKVIDVNGNTLNGCKFSYDLLVDNKLMDEDTVNPVDNKAFYNNNYSIITTLSDKGTYNYELKQNVNDDYTNCRDIDNISIENMNLSLTSTSNSVTAKVTVSNTLDFVRRVDWVLYDEKDNKLKEVSSENLIYNFGGLKSNKLYKVKAKLVSITNKYQERIGEDTTLSIINPYITIKNNPTTSQNGYLYSQTLSVTYNGGGVVLPTYYVKSTKNGNINVNLNMSCGNGSMPNNCTGIQSTNTLNENMWYQVPKNISISYDTETDKIGTVYAVTFDGNNYSSSITATLDKIDRTPPACSWSGESTIWTNSNRTITATCNDSKSGCTKDTAIKSWSYTSGTTKEKNLSYTIKDNVGNTATCSKTANIYVDKEAPTCTSSGGSDAWTKDSRTLVGTCSDSGSGCKDNVSWYINGEGNWTNLSPGTVYDNAGNPTVCPKNQIVRIDRTTPTSSIAMTNYGRGDSAYAVSSGSYVNRKATFTFSASTTSSGNASIRYCVSYGGSCTPNISVNQGTNIEILRFGLTNGDYNIYYKAISPTGVESSINKFAYKLDTVAPNVWCEVNDYGYYVAKCSDNGSLCINNTSDSLYSRFGPLTSAFTIYSSNASDALFENIKAYPGQDLQNGGLLLNSSGEVQYRNTNTFYSLKMYTSYVDHAGNSSKCECLVPKRQG